MNRILAATLLSLLALGGSFSIVYGQCNLLPPIVGQGSDKFPDKLCSQVTADIEYSIRFSSALPAGNTYVLAFVWGDGTANTLVTLPSGQTTYTVTRNHPYPVNSDCEYRVRMAILVNGVYCTTTEQLQFITSWRTDEYNQGLVQLISPTTGNNVHEVCEGVNVDVVFGDLTNFNCNSAYPANYAVPPGSVPISSPNEQIRWQQLIYNTPIAGTKIPNVSVVNGTPTLVTGPGGVDVIANYSDPRGVFQMTTPVIINDARRRNTLQITAPGGFTPGFPTVGQEFEVTIRYWNFCNPYANDFDNTPVNGDLINGDNAPIERTALIRIVDAPPAPVVPNVDICSAEPRTIQVSSVLGAGYQYRLWSNATATTEVTGVGSPNATGTFTNVPVNDAQRVHYWVTVESTATGGCKSEPTEVTITRRPVLAQPTAISGPVNLCPNTTGYTFSTPTTPDLVQFDDTSIAGTNNFTLATEMLWTVPGAVGTIMAGTGTSTITVTSASAVGNGSVSVRRRYVNNTTPVNPPTAVSQCQSNARTLTVNVRARPTATISPDPVNICEGTAVLLNGNPVLPTAAAGFTPTILAHTWGGSTIILDATNVQQPNVLATASPGNYNVTYVITADFGGSVSCSSVSDDLDINISANPAPATVGADQLLCGTLVSNSMGGSNPAPGTGTWTFVSSVPVRPAPSISNINAQNATITIAAGNEGAYTMRWTVVNGSCTSSDDIVVDLGSNPTNPAAGADQFVCAESATLAGNTPIIGSGVWSVVSGPGACAGVGCPITITTPTSPTSGVTLNGPGFTYGAYTLRWTITSGTCTPETDDVIITFNRAATVSAMTDFSFCLNSAAIGTPIPLTGTVGGGASQGRWERVTGNGTIQSSGAANGNAIAGPTINDSYIPTAADFTSGTITVRLVALDPDGAGPTGPCVAVNDNVVITKDLLPTAANAGPATLQTCDPTINLAATAANNGGTGTWSIGSALFYETFTYANGTGLSGPNPHALTFTHSTANWSITAPTTNTLLAADDYMRVQSNVMEAQDLNNAEFVWRSPSVNITAQPNVTVTLQLAEFGGMEATDYIRAFYRLNGAGPEIAIGSIVDDAASDGAFSTFSVTGITGTSIEIIVRALNNATGEFHRFDNIFIAGSGALLPIITDVNSPTSSVSGLPVGNTTFTWTVTSALGVCSSSNDQVAVTRHASPVNNNLTRGLCEDSPGSADATVTLAYLNTLNDLITGIPSSTNRTVQFFSDAGRTVPYPASDVLANNDIVYTRVIRTDVTPNCPTDGTVTITVNARPAAIDQNPEYCEDAVGSNTRTNINLNLLNDDVKNNVAANSVAWFLSLGPDVPVPDPTNVTANDGTTFFARVTDGNGCTNEADIEIQLNPVPPPNALLGPTDVCVDPTAVTLYQLTVNNPGYTYTWSIPDPPFDRIIGGTSTDFLVLLSFPVVVNPGQTISVIETSDKGCVGAPNPRTIKVDTSPPAITIVDASLSSGPGAVCEGENGVTFSVANLANTTYSWTVPPGSSIIAGQGTSTISVNFGTIPGLISVVPTTTTGCAGNPDDYSVAINPRPTLNVLANTVCSDAPAAITLSGAGAVTFNITNVSVPPGLSPASRPLINGALSSEIFNDVFTNTTGGNLTVQYTVVPVSAQNCTGTAQIVNLTIRPEPILAPNLFDEICSTTEAVGITLSLASGSFPADQFEIFSLTNLSGLTQTAGNQTIGVGVYHSSGVLLDDKWENLTGIPATIEYFIRPRNSTTGCVGDPAIPVIVTVNPEPSIPLPAPETICSGDSPTTLITPSIGGSTFSWTVIGTTGLISGHTSGSGPSGSAITDVLINSGVTAATVTYALTPTGPSGVGSCSGQAVNFIVTVNPSPTANNITETVCSDAAGGTTFFIDLTTLESSVNGSLPSSAFTWSENPTMVPLIPTPSAYTLTSPVPNGSVSIYVEVDNGQCTKIATITYTINKLPSISAPPTNVTCNGAANGIITATATPDTGTSPYLFSINAGGTYFPSGTFNGLAPGSYTIRVRDSKGCEVDSAPVPITEPSPVVASSVTVVDALCKGSATGSIQAGASGGVGSVPGDYLYSLNGGAFQASPMFTGLTAGTYTITVRDGNGCIDSELATVGEPVLLTGSIVTQVNVDCNGNSTGSVSVLGSGGVGPYRYELDNSGSLQSGPFTFTGLAAGPHTVTVWDANNCKTDVPVMITQPAILTLTLNSKTDVLCNGGSTGSITVTGSGGTSPYQYDIGTGFQASGTFSGLTAGPYTIIVRDNNNCTTNIGITINQPLLLQGSITTQTNVACFGNSTGSVTVNGSGGTGIYMYSLDGGAFQGSGTFTGLAQGAYVVTVRDANLCTFPVNVTITEPTLLTGSALVTDALCKDTSTGSVTVSGSGGVGPYTFSINGGGLFLPSGTFNNLADGAYTVIVRDNNLCTVNVPFTVNEPALLTISIQSQVNVDCKGNATGSVTLQSGGGTGAHEYSIDGGAFQPSPTFGTLLVGTHIARVRDANLCETSINVIIAEPNFLVVSVASITHVDCNGNSTGSVTVSGTGGTGAYSFSIVPNGNPPGVFGASPTFGSLTAGTYTIYIRDINNCQSQVNATVTQPNVLALDLVSKVNVLCNGQATGTLAVQGKDGTGPYEYSINGGPFTANNNFSFLTAQPYTITVRDFKNCQTSINETITEPTPLIGSATPVVKQNTYHLNCINDADGELTVTASGGTGNPLVDFDYLLLEDAGNVPSGGPVITFGNLRAGSYRVRIMDANNCIVTTTAVSLIQPTDISLEIEVTSNYGVDQTDISCVGASDGEVSVLATISGGAQVGGGTASGLADYTYQLMEGAIPSANTSGDVTGEYTGLTNILYSVVATDANGCSKTSLPVVLIEPIQLFGGFVGLSHDICITQDTPDQFTVIADAFGGNGSYVYQWQESTSSTGPFTNILGATSDTYQAPALTQTTYYQRVTSTANSSGSCLPEISNIVSITVNQLPTATIENQPAVCQGTPFLLDFTFTGAAPFTFDYTTLETGSAGPPTSVVGVIGANVRPIFVNDYQEETTFTITRIVDRNDCVATLPIANRTVPIIKVDADFNITSAVTQCSGSPFTFTYNVDPGVEYTFQWPDGLTDVFTPGTGTVTKTLVSFNPDTNSDLPVVLTARHPSCPALTTSQVVKIYPTIIPNLVTNPTTMCSGTPISVVNLTQGGDDHDWTIVRMSDGAVIQSILNQPNPDSQTITIDNDAPGALNPDTYEIRYNISNNATNGGCTDQVIVPVRVYREVVAAITPPPTIPFWNAMGVDLTFVNSSNPISTDFEYSWTFVSDAVPNAFVGQTPPTIHYNQPGPNKRTRLVASNPAALADPLLLNGCQSVAEYVFTILIPPLTADFTYTPEAACLPADIEITANTSSGDVHQWSVLNQNGVQIYVSGEVTPTFPITSPGEYRIYLTTSSSLSAAAPVTKGPELVRVYANPTAIFEALPSVLFVPDELLRTVNSSVSPVDVMNSPTLHPIYYKWYFGDGTDTLVSHVDPNPMNELSNFAPKHQYLNEGNYDVALLAINDHGNGVVCIDTTVQRVTAKAQGFTRIPNAFTPNSSGPNGGFDDGTSPSRNDVFLPVMKGIKEFKMQIFDRWGNLVFQSTRTDQGWDGYDKNGILLPAGVYVYKLELLLANDTRTTQVGDVTMIR